MPRRCRCSGCSKAKEEDEFSVPQLRADGNSRLCLECERRHVAQKQAGEGQGANFISPAPGSSIGRSTNTTQSSIPPPPISPYRPPPNKEAPVPTKFTGPNVHAKRGIYCIGCKTAKEDFSATMIHAHHTKRMCVDCEKKFGQVAPPQVQKQVDKANSHYSPSVNRSVGELVNTHAAQAQQLGSVSGSRRSPKSVSGLSSSQNPGQQLDPSSMIDAFDVAIDVGGTNTDVVLISRDEDDSDDIKIIETCKEPTTVDITTGIVKAVRHVLTSAAVAPQSVRFVFIGTTTFTNALVERSKQLAKVSVLRLGGQGVESIKPFTTLPQDLQRAVAGQYDIISGGYDLYGNAYLPLDRDGVRDFCSRLASNNGPFNIVVNGCFSPMRTDQEEEVEQTIRSELAQMIGHERVNKEVMITRASDVAGTDLLLREHAAICNAALRPLALKTMAAFYAAFNSTVLPLNTAKVFLTQNDGTILTMTEATKKPILTLGSGPTNSLVGATLLVKAQGLIPKSVQGNLSFEIVASALPLLQRTRHIAGYQYNPYEAPELNKIKERLVVKLGKSPPTEEDKRNCEALGFFLFAPNGQMNSDSFVNFMITAVKCKLSAAELKDLFNTIDVGGTQLICCDIGGTTTDIGIVERSGFPRVSNVTHYVGGVRVNSRCPDTISIGLGGGSHCNGKTDPYSHRTTWTFGPKSVGFNITSNRYGAKCFGGPQLTATDVAVALGHAQIPGTSENRVRNSFARLDDAKNALENMKHMVDEQISLVKSDAKDIPLVLVGGGACLFPSTTKFAGTKDKIIRPLHHDVANAVGAAVARVGADLDEMVSTRNFPKTPNNSTAELIETHYKKKLIQKCTSAGALSDTVVVADWSLESVGFLADTVRVVGRAIGKMDMNRVGTIEKQAELNRLLLNAPISEDDRQDESYSEGDYIQEDQKQKGMSDSYLDITRLCPERPANIQNGIWTVTPEDVELISLGASILGCGGGGETYQGRFRVLNKIVNEGKQVRIISPKALDPQRHVVMPVAFAGAPAVLVETLGSGNELANALKNNIQLCEKQVQGKQVVIMSGEIGGCNGVEPMVCAAREGCLLVDADGMGRAFPYLRHFLCFHAPGAALSPISMSGARDQIRPSVIRETSYEKIEAQVREQLMDKHAGICGLCLPPLSVEQCSADNLCHSSITLAHSIGVALHNARVQHGDVIGKLTQLLGGKVLFTGVIVGNDRTEKRGFTAGALRIRDPHHAQNGEMKINYINENITAQVGNQFVATTPDCISVVNAETGEGIFCSQYKFGVRVAVLAFPSHVAYRTNGTLAHETSPHRMDKDIPLAEPVLLEKPRGAIKSYCDQ